MNEADNACCSNWLGSDRFVWNLCTITVNEEVLFNAPLNYVRYSTGLFQCMCLDVREDELLLDAVGCLDAPV